MIQETEESMHYSHREGVEWASTQSDICPFPSLNVHVWLNVLRAHAPRKTNTRWCDSGIAMCVRACVSEISPDVTATEVTVGEVTCKRHRTPELPLVLLSSHDFPVFSIHLGAWHTVGAQKMLAGWLTGGIGANSDPCWKFCDLESFYKEQESPGEICVLLVTFL